MTRPPSPCPKKDAKSLAAKPGQRDLFQLDSPLTGEIRGERSLMAFPFFALSKNAWMKPLAYEHGPVLIEVRPSANGVATIYDKKIVLYIASLMAAKLEAGEQVEQDFVFTAHDLFSVTGSNHSARSYARLSEALERLQGTQIKTNIEAGGEGEEGFLSLAVGGQAPLHQDQGGRAPAEGGQGALTPFRYARTPIGSRMRVPAPRSLFVFGPDPRRGRKMAAFTLGEAATMALGRMGSDRPNGMRVAAIPLETTSRNRPHQKYSHKRQKRRLRRRMLPKRSK